MILSIINISYGAVHAVQSNPLRYVLAGQPHAVEAIEPTGDHVVLYYLLFIIYYLLFIIYYSLNVFIIYYSLNVFILYYLIWLFIGIILIYKILKISIQKF